MEQAAVAVVPATGARGPHPPIAAAISPLGTVAPDAEVSVTVKVQMVLSYNATVDGPHETVVLVECPTTVTSAFERVALAPCTASPG